MCLLSDATTPLFPCVCSLLMLCVRHDSCSVCFAQANERGIMTCPQLLDATSESAVKRQPPVCVAAQGAVDAAREV